ncbi:unnamed protein product [Paramecium primaurelia]|uniref:Uncharacterized protein n=1 Tax=Paramecium primaurelia TaxID=5886 RepID=A0A8S1NDH9_PARPR|nr:unnamed protein product [Paramecium primaurelia]
MQPESAKIKLASHLFDRGKPPQSNTNKRPLTVKIANRVQMNLTMTNIENVPDQLSSIHEKCSFSYQKSGIACLNQTREKSQNNNDSFPKQNKTLIQLMIYSQMENDYQSLFMFMI